MQKKDKATYNTCDKFYNYIDECLQEVENGDKKNLGKCNTGIEVLKKLGVEV